MIPSKLTPQITAPSPPRDARQVVALQRSQVDRAIQEAAELRVQTSSPGCGDTTTNPLDGSSPPPDATGLELGPTHPPGSGVGPVAGDLNGGATCFDGVGRGTNATCPDRGSGFGVEFTDIGSPGADGMLAIAAGRTPDVQTSHVVAGYAGAASMAAQYGSGASGIQQGGRYQNLAAGAVSGVASGVGAPLDLGRTEPTWPQYALRTYWDGAAYSYRASRDLRTQPFLPITGAPVPDGDEYLTVHGRYGYAVGGTKTEVHAFDLEARTYLGATALPSTHLGYSPIAVSPDGAYALCTTYDYPAVEPPAPQAWLEAFIITAGALAHAGSVSIQHPSNVYGCGDIAFGSDGTAYLTRSRDGDATIGPGFYVSAPPYSGVSLVDLSALFVDPTEAALYGIAVAANGQVIVTYSLSATGGIVAVGTGLLDLGAGVQGGSGIAIAPNGATACVTGSTCVAFVAQTGGMFGPGSTVSIRTIAVSDIHRVFALADGTGFLTASYPFHYVLGAPFTAASPPWAVPADPYATTSIAI
jgi:hypothetical protein